MHDICISSRTDGQPHPAPRHSSVGETSPEPPGGARPVLSPTNSHDVRIQSVSSLSRSLLFCPALGLLILMCNESSERPREKYVGFYPRYTVAFRMLSQDLGHGLRSGCQWMRICFVLFFASCKQDYLLNIRLFTKICTLLYI